MSRAADNARSTLTFIGRIETPYQDLSECPRNVDPDGPECRLVLRPEFAGGLDGLRVGDPILILYWLHQADRSRLHQRSRRNGQTAGTFALRSPHRPNPIGAAVLPIQRIEPGALVVRGLDCLDGTPLLDIKPALRHEQPSAR